MINSTNKEFVSDIQTFLDSMGDGVLMVDKKGKIVKSNKTACDLMEYQTYDMMGKDILLVLGAVDEKGHPINKKNAALFQSIQKGKTVTNAIRQFKKGDGERFWVSITTAPLLNKKKQVKGGIIVLRDITVKKLEEEYRSDFARVAGHNLRSPLGNALWAVEHLLSGRAGKMKKGQTNYLRDTYSLLKQMNVIINDILNISNFQDRKIKANKAKIDFAKVARSVIKNLKYYAKAKNLEVKFDVEDKEKFFVKVDEHHLNTILQNIIENAIKYSYEKTRILVKLEKQNGNVIFSCENKGIGIPQKKQGYVFAKFFRAKNAVDAEGDGTGLGMYTTHELVKLNQGKIWFASEPKKKTIFYVQFKRQ